MVLPTHLSHRLKSSHGSRAPWEFLIVHSLYPIAAHSRFSSMKSAPLTKASADLNWSFGNALHSRPSARLGGIDDDPGHHGTDPTVRAGLASIDGMWLLRRWTAMQAGWSRPTRSGGISPRAASDTSGRSARVAASPSSTLRAEPGPAGSRRPAPGDCSNPEELSRVPVPVRRRVAGEGGSGGAMALLCTDRAFKD